MNTTSRVISLAVLLAGMQGTALALTIDPTSGVLNVTRWEGSQTSQSEIDAAIASLINGGTLVYKNDAPGSETGSLSASYNTTFVPPGDPLSATITHVSGTPFVGGTAFGLVKDGSANPAWYLFNLTALGWNGTDDLVFQNFWPGTGAISHVSLYDAPASVPDSGLTIVLLGFALLATGLLKRKLT
jgi:hypothetical protein